MFEMVYFYVRNIQNAKVQRMNAETVPQYKLHLSSLIHNERVISHTLHVTF